MFKTVERERKKEKKFFILLLVIIAFIIGIIVLISNFSIKIIWGAEGDYTGYQLRLIASYGGRGIGGQNLGSGKIIKTYNIAENDMLYEAGLGGIWELNPVFEETENSIITPSSFFSRHVMVQIIKFEEERVEVLLKNETHYLYYNSEVSVPSNVKISDGINYSYTIKIIKK